MNISDDKWLRVPLEDILIPRAGYICTGPRWWAVNDDNEVHFYKSYLYPQANKDRSIVERMGPEGTHPVFVEMAYLPHRCSDYV